METIFIYNLKTLDFVEIPIKSKKHFEDNITLYYPPYKKDLHSYSDTKFEYPISENGKIREMTKEELYKQGKYSLASNERLIDGKIKAEILDSFEYIQDNQIKFKRDEKIEVIKKELYNLKLEYETTPFEFEKNGIKYLQNNRSIDQSNLTRIVVMCQAAKKTEFENWKFYTKEGSEKYESLTLLEMLKMAEIMEKQTTLAMVTETWLNHELETLTDTELKNYESETRYKQKYNEIKEG